MNKETKDVKDKRHYEFHSGACSPKAVKNTAPIGTKPKNLKLTKTYIINGYSIVILKGLSILASLSIIALISFTGITLNSTV